MEVGKLFVDISQSCLHISVVLMYPFSIPYCRSIWWEGWRTSFHSADHSGDQQDFRPFLLNWQEVVENLWDSSSFLNYLQKAMFTSCLGVAVNTVCRHGNTIKGIPYTLKRKQAMVMLYLPYWVTITMTTGFFPLSLLSHIATLYCFPQQATMMLGVRLLWVCVWRTDECSICLFICLF